MEAVERKMDKCAEFFRKMFITHNKCLTPLAQRLQEFQEHEEPLKQLNDKLQVDELNIQLVKGLDAKVVNILVAEAVVSNSLLEDLFTVRFLGPTKFKTIASDASAQKQFVDSLTRSA